MCCTSILVYKIDHSKAVVFMLQQMLNFNSTAQSGQKNSQVLDISFTTIRSFCHINHPIQTADLRPMYVLQTNAVAILRKTFCFRIKFIWNDVLSYIWPQTFDRIYRDHFPTIFSRIQSAASIMLTVIMETQLTSNYVFCETLCCWDIKNMTCESSPN